MEVVGFGREGALLMREGGGWSEILVLYCGEGQKFSISNHENYISVLEEGVPPKSPITPTISDYFLYN